MSWLIRMLLKPGEKRYNKFYEDEINTHVLADEMMRRN